MAYSEQFTCDVCGAVRQKSNNWYLIRFGFPSIIIRAFNANEYKEYDRDLSQIILCGEACVSKWVSQNLASLHFELKTAASQTVLESSEISHFDEMGEPVLDSPDTKRSDIEKRLQKAAERWIKSQMDKSVEDLYNELREGYQVKPAAEETAE